jgi:translation initiation factor eIF-2B subunit beta
MAQAQLEQQGAASSGANKEEQQQLQSPNDIRQWLQRKHLQLLDKFIAEINSSAAERSGGNHNHNRWKVVVGTVNVVRHLIGSTHWTTAAELLLLLKGIGRELPDSDPAIGNAVRRIMAAVREETEGDQQKKDNGEAQYQQQQQQQQQNRQSSLSLETMLWSLPQHVRSKPPQRSSRNLRQESLASESEFCTNYNDGNNNDHANKRSNSNSSIVFPADYYTNRPNLKMSVQEAIQEILSDLEDMRKNINDQVGLHLHQGEVILTCGHSRTIVEFLKATKHKVTVIVCGDLAMAASLQKAQHTVYHIEYAAVVAVLSRVHKVLLPAYAVLANGGLVSDAGANLVALAAQAQSIPTICVTGIYKLCPRYPHEGQGTLQDWIVPPDPARGTVQPVHDYIAPHLVSLYITNVGSFPPSLYTPIGSRKVSPQ